MASQKVAQSKSFLINVPGAFFPGTLGKKPGAAGKIFIVQGFVSFLSKCFYEEVRFPPGVIISTIAFFTNTSAT